ncbi:hypothetical protein [Paractinoplanes abujensis]|uniref:HEAT repeat protein n=1 Tax=Paractinoplanes abujensis TaxID=882441 RepID=A0A7W7CMB3_9ACTN|nr:hypothetical protein [Actinoplanes abujensis]MBB4690904.1 HEAT repeat protein [Actinoplanes abujensis]
MFAGLDDIDWESLEHAYGSAEDVPGWVRGLVDPDPAVREESLDALYGAVHHQGDVYDSTVAAVPFLTEALTTPGAPGRDGIAQLLTSVADLAGWPDEADLPDERRVAMRGLAARAHALAVAAAPALSALADDPDPGVRGAAPKLLAALGVDGLDSLLIGLLGTEDDPAARMALFDALGSMELGDDAVARLLGLVGSAPASTGLAALIAVARSAPERAPLAGAAGLIERAYAEDGAAVEPEGFHTDTVIGSLRVMRERMEQGRRAPHCSRMVEDLTDALGPRVADRIAIVTPLLASPHDDLAGDALWAVNKLIEGWRGDYRQAVSEVAGFLERSPQLAERAAGMLPRWGPVAAPAAEAVARRVADLDAQPWRDGLPRWVIPYGTDLPGLHPHVGTLGELGDERVLPLLLTALRLPRRPRNLGALLARFPGHADRIMAAVPDPDWSSLYAALRVFGPAAAPAVPGLLAAPLQDWSAVTLGRIGPAATEALPALRLAARGDDARLAVAAAGALWRIDRSPEALAVLTAHLDGPAATAAFAEVAAMGPAAAAAAPLIATYVDVPDQHWWTPVAAVLALWHLTGEAGRVAPVLTAAWHGNRRLRVAIAEAATGPLADALGPLLRAEASAVRRFNASPGSWSSNQVAEDERLLALCRA